MSGYPQALPGIQGRTGPFAEIRMPAALLVPNLAVVVFVVALVQVLFLSAGAPGLLQDSDTGWHIRNGEAILQTLTIPRADTFSYTHAGQQWFAWEWLSDVVLGAAHLLAGLPGVALLAAFTIAFTAWGVTQLSMKLGANLFVTAAGVVLLIGTTSIHWLARPHLFSWMLALAFIATAETERRTRNRALYLLPVLACVWVNVHGSFLLGPGILVVYAIGERHKRIAKAAVLSLLATFVNPYGWRLHSHVITYLQTDYLMDHIGEFRSFSFHSAGAYYVELFLAVAVCGIFAMLRQRAYGPALLGIVMLHLSLYSARHLPVAAVVILPLAASALTYEARQRGWFTRMLDYSDRLRSIDQRVFGSIPLAAALIAILAGVSVMARNGDITFSAKNFPVQAADFIERNHLVSRVFSKDQWGGYLIYRLQGRTKVFIDGRSDFYGPHFLETYSQIIEVKQAWSDLLKQYDAGLVLIPTDHALASALSLSPQWRRIYSDSLASLFERVS